jgi:hypothetical protein
MDKHANIAMNSEITPHYGIKARNKPGRAAGSPAVGHLF